jgi:hypothetical protein
VHLRKLLNCGEPLWLSGKVVKNEKINEIQRTRVRSPPRATSLKNDMVKFLKNSSILNKKGNFYCENTFKMITSIPERKYVLIKNFAVVIRVLRNQGDQNRANFAFWAFFSFMQFFFITDVIQNIGLPFAMDHFYLIFGKNWLGLRVTRLGEFSPNG